LFAEQIAARERTFLSDAVSRLVRAGASVDMKTNPIPLRGRFALLPQRDGIITTEHVRALMGHVGS